MNLLDSRKELQILGIDQSGLMFSFWNIEDHRRIGNLNNRTTTLISVIL